MSEAATTTGAQRLGFRDGDVVQEFGYDDDVDFGLREDIEDLIGGPLLEEDEHDVADAVLLWHRDDDGDLVDALMDVLTGLDENGVVWVLSPKSGRPGYVSPAEVLEAAPTAGLHVTSSAGVSEDWSATRLVPRRKK
ncbi:DUF3052 domain-containing protein [Psychromicrobium xiongbiense]|uniref:DUF3052 domain-containing protein n=1 Tax=Psychromicrobium xiongbiense TaxID=3051184 RepID=UPI002556A93D|nr:DUF3052 domain-containing protein [Psychromicrobium sp. YIM S02556]